MKIAFARHPHPRQSGKVIDLIDVAQANIDEARIEHRARHIFNFRQRKPRRANVENSYLSALSNECRYEVLSDEAAAASDKYLGHERGSCLPCRSSEETEGPRSAR